MTSYVLDIWKCKKLGPSLRLIIYIIGTQIKTYNKPRQIKSCLSSLGLDRDGTMISYVFESETSENLQNRDQDEDLQ